MDIFLIRYIGLAKIPLSRCCISIVQISDEIDMMSSDIHDRREFKLSAVLDVEIL